MTKKQYQMHFASLSEVSEFISNTPRTQSLRESENITPSPAWDLGAGYEGALALARDGWKDGARNLAAGLEALRPPATVTTRRYSVAGSRPSPVKFATGNPRCMMRARPEAAPKPPLVIAVQIGASGATQAEHMSNYGLAIASYVERLSREGYPVEVIAGDIYDYSDRRLVVSWAVKRINAPMNFSDMAFSLGHPAAMRRISFAASERGQCNIGTSYGAAGPLYPSDFEGRNVILLNGMESASRHSKTPEEALEGVSKAIREAMEAMGV